MQVFRYLDVEAHADRFVRGEVMVTTLEHCRRAEGARRDADEAKHTYRVCNLSGVADDPEVQRQLARTPFPFRGPGEIDLDGFSVRTEIDDAYVFCSTLQPSDVLRKRFGPYCIRISDVSQFFNAVTDDLVRKVPILRGGSNFVKYGPRELDISSPEDIGTLGFMKPTSFQDESEFRSLWLPKGKGAIDRVFVNAPQIATLCERIA